MKEGFLNYREENIPFKTNSSRVMIGYKIVSSICQNEPAYFLIVKSKKTIKLIGVLTISESHPATSSSPHRTCHQVPDPFILQLVNSEKNL